MHLAPAYSLIRGAASPWVGALAATAQRLLAAQGGTAAAAAAAAALQRRLLSTSAGPEPDVECAVIGAGVIGLAIARELALAGRSVLLLEAAGAIGTETSSRNSEVIHAGLYYPAGSLKARLCVEGRRALYAFCREHGVPHARLGKLLVATSEAQLEALEVLRRRAEANGVTDLRPLTGTQAAELEPAVRCRAALLSPSTGIVDSHSLMAELHRQFEAAGGTTAFHSRVQGGAVAGLPAGLKRLAVVDVNSGEGTELTAQLVVNAAGLHAQAVAASLQGLPSATIPPLHLAKGNYFSLAAGAVAHIAPPADSPPTSTSAGGSSSGGEKDDSSAAAAAAAASGQRPRPYAFRHLVYPLPEPGTAGLGTHLTLDLAGGVRFGPDVEWLPPGTDPSKLDYRVNPARAAPFYAAIRAYLPGLPDGALLPAYSGVRPKVVGPGQPAADFVLAGPRAHGVPGLLCCYGIESPGLTASLALAKEAAARLLDLTA